MSKTQVKILWTGDWHLRDRQYNKKFRGNDFFNAALNVCHAGLKHEVDAIINAGDILDTYRPSSVVPQQLMRIHDNLVGSGLKMLTISGNHDKAKPSWTDLPNLDDESWEVPEVENGVLPNEEQVRRLEDLPTGIINADYRYIDVEGLKILGIPFESTDILRELLAKLSKRKMKPDVLILHCAVKEFISFPAEHILELKDFEATANVAVLLGDIHVRKMLRTPDQLLIGYPGSIEMCNLGEDELKSVELLTFTREGPSWVITEQKQIPVATRPVWRRVIGTLDDFDQFLAELTAHFVKSTIVPLIHLDLRAPVEHAHKRIQSVIGDRDAYFQVNESFRVWNDAVTVGKMSSVDLTQKRTMLELLPSLEDRNTAAFSLCERVLGNPDKVKDFLEEDLQDLYERTKQ